MSSIFNIIILFILFILGAFTQSASITGWSIAHNADRWPTSYRIISTTRIRNTKRASWYCCWNRVRKCYIHRLNNHTSNFSLETRVDKPAGSNSSDGNDQIFDRQARERDLTEAIYIFNNSWYNLCRTGVLKLSDIHIANGLIKYLYVLKSYTFVCAYFFIIDRVYIM